MSFLPRCCPGAIPAATLLMLAACTDTQVTDFRIDATATLSDVIAAEALIAPMPGVPSRFVGDMTLADNGLSGLLAAVKANSTKGIGASLPGAQAAVADFKAELPNDTMVQTDVGLAETALAAVASPSTSAERQAFLELAALTLAVETAEQGTTATRDVAAVSPGQNLIDDANGHLANQGR